MPYDPEVLFLDQIEEMDETASRITCWMPTEGPMPFTRSQRAHETRHPRHVAGAVLVHVTGMLGFVHAYHLEHLRHHEGWVGYGTHITRAVFRKLVPPGLPIRATCTQTRVRRGNSRIFSTYRFAFLHDGDVAYESEQNAMWVKVPT